MSLPLTRRRVLAGSALLLASALAGCSGEKAAPSTQAPSTEGAPPPNSPAGQSSAAGVVGSGSAAPTASSGKRGGTLRAAVLATPQETLDASLPAADNITQVRNFLVYERLASLDEKQQVRRILYTDVQHSADGRSWTFTLDKRAAFADGSPVTGQDVLDSLNTLLPTEAAANLTMIDPKASTADGSSVTLALSYPVADLERRLAGSYFIVMKGGKGSADPGKMNGSGPYRVTGFRAGQRTELQRRKDYWAGDERGMADTIELIGVADPAARMRALKSGQVDLADDVSFVDAKAAGDQQVIHQAPAPFVYELIMNGTLAPFDDVRVRQALRLAVDRQRLVDSVAVGYGKPGNDLWGAQLPGYATDIPQRTRDLEQAKKLLAQAGKPTVTATIYAAELAPGLVAGTRLLADQAKEAGFELTVQEMDPAQYYAQVQQWHTWPGVAFTMGLSFEQMADFLYLPQAPFNFGWDKPGWAERYNAALGEFDPAAKQKALDGLQRDLWESGPDLVWGLAPKLIATRPGVTGLEAIGDFNYPDLTDVAVG